MKVSRLGSAAAAAALLAGGLEARGQTTRPASCFAWHTGQVGKFAAGRDEAPVCAPAGLIPSPASDTTGVTR